MLPSVIRVCCASLFLLFETLELRLALLAAYTQIAWRLFVCLCRGLFSYLSLSLYLSLSFQCPVAKPDTVSSASTSSSSGFATCCYCYPSRDASVSAICPCFLFFGVFLFLRRPGGLSDWGEDSWQRPRRRSGHLPEQDQSARRQGVIGSLCLWESFFFFFSFVLFLGVRLSDAVATVYSSSSSRQTFLFSCFLCFLSLSFFLSYFLSFFPSFLPFFRSFVLSFFLSWRRSWALGFPLPVFLESRDPCYPDLAFASATRRASRALPIFPGTVAKNFSCEGVFCVKASVFKSFSV